MALLLAWGIAPPTWDACGCGRAAATALTGRGGSEADAVIVKNEAAVAVDTPARSLMLTQLASLSPPALGIEDMSDERREIRRKEEEGTREKLAGDVSV